MFSRYEIFQSNVLTQGVPLPDKSVHCCITSPPYHSLRDYGVDGQVGQEELHDCSGWATGNSCGECFVCHLVQVFRHVRRVLRDDGTLIVNLGDSYSGGGRGNYDVKSANKGNAASRGLGRPTLKGLKPKDLCMIPARFALAMQADGWTLRSKACWIKVNAMTESVQDRPSNATEEFFLFTKGPRYYYDIEATKIDGITDAAARNRRTSDWWKESLGFLADEEGMPLGLDFPVAGFRGAHFATFPVPMIEPWVRAATSDRGCCPECGEPYRRLVERERVPTRTGKNSKVEWTGDGVVTDSETTGNRDPLRHITTTRTVGWKPGCECNAGNPVPCRVLDCFSGAASTGIACLNLDRDYRGCELNPAYIDMSLKRLADHKEYLRTGVKPKAVAEADTDQMSLFAKPSQGLQICDEK